MESLGLWAVAFVVLGMGVLWPKAVKGLHFRLYGPHWQDRPMAKLRVMFAGIVGAVVLGVFSFMLIAAGFAHLN